MLLFSVFCNSCTTFGATPIAAQAISPAIVDQAPVLSCSLLYNLCATPIAAIGRVCATSIAAPVLSCTAVVQRSCFYWENLCTALCNSNSCSLLTSVLHNCCTVQLVQRPLQPKLLFILVQLFPHCLIFSHCNWEKHFVKGHHLFSCTAPTLLRILYKIWAMFSFSAEAAQTRVVLSNTTSHHSSWSASPATLATLA